MDIPPQCPPGMTVDDVFVVYSQHIAGSSPLKGFPCYIQTPDNLKGQEPMGYPYFDFDSVHQQDTDNPELQSDEMSATEFYLTLLLGGITFLAFVIGFTTGFLYLD